MFASHFERGLSPPINPFLGKFLVFYGIQLHHLTPDCITYMSCYLTLCEGYFDIHPHLGLWCSLFYLTGRIAGEGGNRIKCGVMRVVPHRPWVTADHRPMGAYGFLLSWTAGVIGRPCTPGVACRSSAVKEELGLRRVW